MAMPTPLTPYRTEGGQMLLRLYSGLPAWPRSSEAIIQPSIFSCLIQPWLQVFPLPGMKQCFLKLIALMNDFRASPISFPIAS